MRSEYGQVYAELYHHHWWWRAREAIILRHLRRLGLGYPIRILDVGCGAGLFLPRLAEWGEVAGIEVDTTLLDNDTPYRDRIYTRPLGDPVYRNLRFDLITALDVIEHIEDDTGAVADMVAMLQPGGKLLITVPAFMLLWDEHDVINQHHRRYTRASLRRLLAPHGRLLHLRYLFHGLFGLKLAVKLVNLARRRKIQQHRLPHAGISRIMAACCRAEYRLLSPLPVPWGTSVLAILEKPRGGAG